jgi:prolyl oligopeptidase
MQSHYLILLLAMTLNLLACQQTNNNPTDTSKDSQQMKQTETSDKEKQTETSNKEKQAQEQVKTETPDPYLWLEDVNGEKALDWVKSENAITQKQLESDPEFSKLREDLLAIHNSTDKIPFVKKIGNHLYNFWKDQKNPRGLWRRTTLAEYQKKQPKWETVLDIDALNQTEKKSWVWHDAECLKPEGRYCLIALSEGGTDADETREFDLKTKTFVKNGFFRPSAKGELTWIDQNTVYVYTDFGTGSLTDSGYPRIVKEWKRNTPLESATVIYEGQKTDMYISAYHDSTKGFERDFVIRTLAFYNNEYYYRKPNAKADEAPLMKLDLPNSAEKHMHKEWLLLELREDYTTHGNTWKKGALIACLFEDFLAETPKWFSIFEPTETSSLSSFSWTKDQLLVNVLDQVKNKVYAFTPSVKETWQKEEIKTNTEFGTVSISPMDSDQSNAYWMIVTDYLTPSTLYLAQPKQALLKLKETPAFFNATGLKISQHFVKSKDGTEVPYFMIAQEKLNLNGENPTILYGYGGFEIALTPNYNASVGRAWLQNQGVYVVANIRGGGEYGPRWHQAALKQNRLRAYEDFAAVAQDLIDRKITNPTKLGIHGGSNGGLLVGNMSMLYPTLFSAVVCQVPLLDMKRFHLLLAGASWMAEYGNPDLAEEWAFIQSYSPYQMVKKELKYPVILFSTSTKDDRVHPGHARKMMKKMKDLGHEVWYYENIEGGHGGAADNGQLSYMQAINYTFFKNKLFQSK